MQIHEITRRKTSEGILKGIANFGRQAGAVARGAARQAGAVARGAATAVAGNVLSQLPVDVSRTVKTPGAASAAAAQALGAKLNKTLIPQNVQRLSQDWDRILNDLVKQSGAYPGQAKWPQDELDNEIDDQINRVLLNRKMQWQDLDKYFASSPEYGKVGAEAKRRIEQARASIINAKIGAANIGADGKISMAKNLNQPWTDLVTAAFDAVNLLQFYNRQRSAGTDLSTAGLEQIEQAAQNSKLTASQVGVPKGDLTTLASLIKPGTIEPKTLIYLQSLGLLPKTAKPAPAPAPEPAPAAAE